MASLVKARPGSSVGTSVRLKIGRSAVRPRPWPPQTRRSQHCPAGLFVFKNFKQWRGLATRYDKLAVIFRGAAILRSIIMWLRSPLGDTP